MKKIIVLLFIIQFAISCNVELETKFGVYTAQGFKVEQTKLFTHSGEIVDKHIIANFINRYDFRHSFIQNIDSMIDLSKIYRLKYKSSSEIMFFQGNDTIFYKVKSQNEILYLETLALFSEQIDYYRDFTQPQFLLYKPLHADTIHITENTGKFDYVRYIPCNFATICDNKITFTYLSYGLYNKKFGIYSCESGINNTFDNRYLNLMNSDDTLAIQQSQIIFIK